MRSSRDARRSSATASCGLMPRSRSSSWAAVHARSIARWALCRSWYFSVRRSACSRLVGDAGREGKRARLPGAHLDRAPDGAARVEHAPDGARELAAALDGDGAVGAAEPAEERGAVGLVRPVARHLVARDEVQPPDALLRRSFSAVV